MPMTMIVLALFLMLGLACTAHGQQQGRIVGGSIAEARSWPWQVSLQNRPIFFLPWSHFCGGSIVASNWVVTAAHCVDGMSSGSVRVVANLHQQPSDSASTSVSVSQIIMHPGYSSSDAGFPNDIALMKLSSSVSGSNTVPLAGHSLSFLENPDCWITGWGKTSANSGSSTYLMEAQMNVISNGDCAGQWEDVTGADIGDHHICIEAEGRSSCNGDSGGPLVCRVNGEYVLAGATSWGISTCEGFPSVYTRVSHFADWIQEVLSSN